MIKEEKGMNRLLSELPLLHKYHSEEVFLNSCIHLNSEYKGKALLHHHLYYCDHIKPLTDLMFILECVRQAETYLVHKYEHQPINVRFILSSWSCNFVRGFLPTVDLLGKNIHLKVKVKNTRRVKNKLLSQCYDACIFLNGDVIANVGMSVKYMTNEAYCKIREKSMRATTKNTYDKLMGIYPNEVYRKIKSNVLISSPCFDGKKLTSILSVNMKNKAYFDHKQDHYPAMVLMEAGKQTCQLFFSKVSLNKVPVLTKMVGDFFMYAELDKEVQITAFEGSSIWGTQSSFIVKITQMGVEVARMQYSFSIL